MEWIGNQNGSFLTTPTRKAKTAKTVSQIDKPYPSPRLYILTSRMKQIILFVFTTLTLVSCRDEYIVEPTRSRWAIGVKLLEPFNIYAETKLKHDTTWHKVFYSEPRPTKRGLCVDQTNRPPNDTISVQYFEEYVDTVLLYYIDGLDTHYTNLDLTKLTTYYLSGVSIYDNGLQNFNYVVDIDSTSFD